MPADTKPAIADPGRIVTERRRRLFLIGIDRPKKYNGFTPKMLTELAEAYTAYERDPEAWCAVLHAEGQHFTAGLQLSAFDITAELIPPGLVDPLALQPPFRTKPVVVAVKGFCFTIGIELMLAADIVVAEEGTRFAQVEVKRGLAPFGGATIRFVERTGWGNAMRYLLTGDEFDPATAPSASCRRSCRKGRGSREPSRSPRPSPNRHPSPSAPRARIPGSTRPKARRRPWLRWRATSR